MEEKSGLKKFTNKTKSYLIYKKKKKEQTIQVSQKVIRIIDKPPAPYNKYNKATRKKLMKFTFLCVPLIN